MNIEDKIDEMNIAVLVCYRNQYINEDLNTEQGIIAHALDKVLPVVIKLNNELNEGCN